MMENPLTPFVRPMRLKLPPVLLAAVFANAAFAEIPAPTKRPLIWTRAADRAQVLQRIEQNDWLQARYEAIAQRAQSAVDAHQADRAGFLLGLPWRKPVVPGKHPTLPTIYRDRASAEDLRDQSTIQRYVILAVDCGVIYHLTGEEDYARCAADVLHAIVEGLLGITPNPQTFNGGWIYQEDHLYESRSLGAQIPLIYDFIAPYLHAGGRPWDLAAGSEIAFQPQRSQQVFRTYVNLALEHGIIDSNWPALELPSLMHNILVLDDPAERARLLEIVIAQDLPHQDSIHKILREFDHAGGAWPESFQYSGAVSQLMIYTVALLGNHHTSLGVPASFAEIAGSLSRLQDFRFPNGYAVRLGDGPRQQGLSESSLEVAYAAARKAGHNVVADTIGAELQRLIQTGTYDRARSRGAASGPTWHFDPLSLFWFEPDLPEASETPPPLPVTDSLRFAGLVLQRNVVAGAPSPRHDLMAAVSGGHFVHAHASGMALELYGVGQVLGTPAGKGNYRTDEHENYRRLFAAYNTVIVNGASRSEGGWINMGINQVLTIALEPAVGASPASPRHSFTLTRFHDDRGDGAEAEQERLVGIVRTAADHGFYVDVFRSRSELPHQFHDYLFRSVGDSVTAKIGQQRLPQSDAPDRFQPAPGTQWIVNETYLWPGWHFFAQTKVSPPTSAALTIDFEARRLSDGPVTMRLHVPAGIDREVATAMAPVTKDVPDPYGNELTPTLALRQQGDAWDQPFAVVYEPIDGNPDSSRIESVVALTAGGRFAGLDVRMRHDGQRHLVIIPPADALGGVGEWSDPALGLSVRGRYAALKIDDAGTLLDAYLGDGAKLLVDGKAWGQ